VERQAFKGEAGVPNTRVFRVVGWEAGVPNTRVFRVVRWEAGLRAGPVWQQGCKI
jgi:hypothetical protein